MRVHIVVILSALISAFSLGCGPTTNAGVDSAPTPNDGALPQNDGQVAPDGPAPTVDAGQPAVSVCLVQCTVPADCAAPSAPYDADNYDCQTGTCTYTGCNSDAECQALGDYVCRANGGLSLCQMACNSPSDCGLGSVAYDADNYQCDNGGCLYSGCNNDAECQALGNYVCRPIAGIDLDTCQVACTSVADCDLGSAPYDVDNYACLDDVCVYQGCNGDAECQTLGDYVCSP